MVVKPWYGCVIVDSCTCTLSDLYCEFSGRQLDGSLPLLDEYHGAPVELYVGRTKTDLVRVEFCLTKLDTASGDSTMIQSSLLVLAKEVLSIF